ncbi:RNA polymerase subunit sigma, partial [Streptomyces sp. MCAF7]
MSNSGSVLEVLVRDDAAVTDAHRSRSQRGTPDEELMRALYQEHAGPLLAFVLR